MKHAEGSPCARRAAIRERMTRTTFDLVIIGGGINGASIARDAALRGYTVALLEQADFASGTSSRSSRLIHGGLRYLEHGEVGLVFESVSERACLRRMARHLVHPLPFLFPVYRGDKPLLMISAGLWLYDALALFRNHRVHEDLTALGVTDEMPGITTEGLEGGVYYYDCQTDDARLVLENVLSAVEAGACVLSRCRVTALENTDDRRDIIQAVDLLCDDPITLRGRTVVCAAGPWTDQVLGLTPEHRTWLRPTKGVHVVVPRERLPVDAALAVRHPEDGRALFAIPYHEATVLGTTDTDFSGDPAAVNTTAEDVRYLLSFANHFFPGSRLTADDIISGWAGVRPLLSEESANAPSAVSREHRIEVRPDGMVVIAGGKLTTYRRMAIQCVDAAARSITNDGGPPPKRRAPTHRLPLPGAVGISSDEALESLAGGLRATFGTLDRARHLVFTYGVRVSRLVALAEADASAAAPIYQELPFVWGQITFAAREELALSLEDALVRRTQIFYRAHDQGLSVVERAAELLGHELGWNAEERARQVEIYRELVRASRAWREPDSASAVQDC